MSGSVQNATRICEGSTKTWLSASMPISAESHAMPKRIGVSSATENIT